MLAPVALAKIEGCWSVTRRRKARERGPRSASRPYSRAWRRKSYSALADALRGYGGGLSRPAGKVLAQGRFEAAPGEVDGAVAARQRPRRAGNSAEARNILASALKSRETNAPTRLELRFRPCRPRRTIVVGEANNWMRRFHLRMPIILAAAARRGRLSKRPFER